MRDEFLLKIIAVVVIMVGMSALASTDPNNPLQEVSLPVDTNDFNIYHLANQAPQIVLLETPEFNTTAQDRYCWIEWFCPDLPTDEIAQALHRIAVIIFNVFAMIANGILSVATVIFLLATNTATLFNFTSWAIFQTHPFLVFFSLGLTVTLGGSIIIWIVNGIRGSIPMLSGGGNR